MKGQNTFGAWQEHTKDQVFDQFIAKAGITQYVQNLQCKYNPIQTDTIYNLTKRGDLPLLDNIFSKASWQTFLTSDPAIPNNLADRMKEVIKSMRIAKNSPWTFADACAASLEYNGRIYMQGQYAKWESYERAARNSANYQFSSSVEWFAEAYAAFYNPEENAASRNQLSANQRDWFLNTLGDHA